MRRYLFSFPSFAPLLAGALLLLVWAWLQEWPGEITAVDINQHRAAAALPIPRDQLEIRQGFTPRRDGLTEVELLLVRYGQTPPGAEARFKLTLLDDQGHIVAQQGWDSHRLTHNQTLALRFPPQPNSAGRPYTLLIQGEGENNISVWGYPLEAHAGGALTLSQGETAAQDLRLITRYQLGLWAALTLALTMLWQEGSIILLTLAYLLLPGCLLLALVGDRWPIIRREPAIWWTAALVFGLSLWPLLWFGLTLLGGRWSGGLLWLFFVAGWTALLIAAYRRRRAIPIAGKSHLVHLLLLLLLFATLSLRLLAARDLAFPPWVDASRHALISAVMAESGQTMTTYEPYLQVNRFPYHFGFHTLSAGLYMMTGWSLPRLLLVMGQLLSSLMPLVVYAGLWLITRRPLAGLIAAFLVALPFFFPAYYTTWGRLTQLTGMLILPIALAFSWQVARGGRAWRASWWGLALLLAGLFYVHFRVFLYFLPVLPLIFFLSRGRHYRWLLASAGLTTLLILPRLVQLATMIDPVRAVTATIPGYQAFPIGYVTTGWEQEFWLLAGLLLLLVLLGFLRRRRWSWLPYTLVAWTALLFLILFSERVGLPGTALINLNSMYISLFAPLALFLGATIDAAWRWSMGRHWLWRVGVNGAVGAALAAAILFGARQQITILNPQTILAHEPDLAAIEWLAQETPADAHLASTSWLWLGATWAGRDGGAWILPLTGRSSTIPPADYAYDPALLVAVNQFNEAAQAVEDWSAPAAADWLRQEGVTHVYVGARGGFFEPAQLARNSQMELLYARDGVFIFALEPQPP